ncbi:hypothetical protein PCL1606_50310 [Pseudomonas chlororaphis]|uniref:Uncharacterized protein n=1 Tax=Pseudomonas chlororaphis TaxID=587753 RepID=A0A0D5Y567_9PSED|nr:hypothetical protein PCL1606_50310 [Pseudomonas chlororaphis]
MLFWILHNRPGECLARVPAPPAPPEAAVTDIQDVDLNTALMATGTGCLVSKVVKLNHELSVGKP